MKNEKFDPLAEETAPQLNWEPPGASSNGLLPLAVFVIMFVAFSIFANNFFTVRGALNLLVQTITFTILAIGTSLVMVVG